MIATRHRTTDPGPGTASAPPAQAFHPLSEDEMGGVLSNLDRPAEALALYEQALRRHPDDALAYTGKGNMLLVLNRPAEALVAYSEAARLAPTFALAYAGQGMALRELGRDQAALDAYDQADRVGPLLRARVLWQGLCPAASQALLAGALGLSARVAPGAAYLLIGQDAREPRGCRAGFRNSRSYEQSACNEWITGSALVGRTFCHLAKNTLSSYTDYK